MVKCYQLVRGKESKPMDNRCYKQLVIAKKEMLKVNKEFKEFNQFIKDRKLDRKPIQLVRVKQIKFSRKGNILL